MFKTLISDFRAVFDRDPAARGVAGTIEVILSYSGFHAIISHRLCHFLYRLGIPVLPRLISQFARFMTGIEIHPGARIGASFFIDHGMGVVIGETTVIGSGVTLFQGVTLGGTGKQTGKRHPNLEDNVVVGAGAKVLGNITIGKNSFVGAGSVVVHDVPSDCTVVGVPGQVVRRKGMKLDDICLDHTNLPDPLRDRLAKIQHQLRDIHHNLAHHLSDVEQQMGKAAGTDPEQAAEDGR